MGKPKGKRKMQGFLIYFVAKYIYFFFFEKLVVLYILQFQHHNNFYPGHMKHGSRKYQQAIDYRNYLFHSFVRL